MFPTLTPILFCFFIILFLLMFYINKELLKKFNGSVFDISLFKKLSFRNIERLILSMILLTISFMILVTSFQHKALYNFIGSGTGPGSLSFSISISWIISLFGTAFLLRYDQTTFKRYKQERNDYNKVVNLPSNGIQFVKLFLISLGIMLMALALVFICQMGSVCSNFFSSFQTFLLNQLY